MKFKIFAFLAFFAFSFISFKPFSTLGATYPPYMEVFDITNFQNWDYGVFVNDNFYSVIDSEGDSTGSLTIIVESGGLVLSSHVFGFTYYGGLGDYYFRVPNCQSSFSHRGTFGLTYYFPFYISHSGSSFPLPYPSNGTFYSCIYDDDFCYIPSLAITSFRAYNGTEYNTMTDSQFSIRGYHYRPIPPRAELYGSNFYTFHVNLFDRLTNDIILNDSVIVENYTSNWIYSNPNFYFSPLDFPFVVKGLLSDSVGTFYFVDSHSLLYVSDSGGNYLKAPSSSSPPTYATDFDLNNINLDSLSNTFSPFISRIMALSWGSLALIWILPIATIIVAFLWRR